MHTNYYFLRQLVRAIRPDWEQAVINEAYTQEKNELIFHATSPSGNPLYLRAYLSPSFCCLSFPEVHHRARKNSMNLFSEIEGQSIQAIRMYENERAFALEFRNELTLVFKMFGNRSNLVLFTGDQVKEVFRSDLKNDYSLTKALDRPIQRSFDIFQELQGDYLTLYPTFGKRVKQFLREKGFDQYDLKEKWTLLQETEQRLNHPDYRIVKEEEIYLSLLPEEGTIYKDPVIALNAFFRLYFMEGMLTREKSQLIRRIEKTVKRKEKHLSKLTTKREGLLHQHSYRQQADLLMAHMHQIKTGARETLLPDFYDPDNKIRIPLNPALSPQENASNLYRKAKNQHLELEQLDQAIQKAREDVETMHEHLKTLEPVSDLKELRSYAGRHGLEEKSADRGGPVLPYKEFNLQGFVIRLGKHARANDEMLQQHSYKDDLWLHAKDAPGSHVLIKYQSGHSFPAPVIEKAASLAAYHSRRRNDTLCPVIVTPRKFVRKRKGDPPGMVAVDREEKVLLVPPQDFS